MSNAQSKKMQAELARIQWRDTVMRLPGGVSWLLEHARRFKLQERQLGPWLGTPGVQQ